MSKQHVQVPNDMTPELTPKDLLIYACIKKYMNNKTREAFPSLETIMQIAGASKTTVRKCIGRLKETGYISVRKDGRKNVYKFSEAKDFEPFSYDFLDKEDLTSNEKAYIIAAQQYMFKENGEGIIRLSDMELSQKLNISYPSIRKYNLSLEEKGYMENFKLNKRDSATGLTTLNGKTFYLNELEQAIVFTLGKHDEEIKENKSEIELLKQRLSELEKQNGKVN